MLLRERLTTLCSAADLTLYQMDAMYRLMALYDKLSLHIYHVTSHSDFQVSFTKLHSHSVTLH